MIDETNTAIPDDVIFTTKYRRPTLVNNCGERNLFTRTRRS